MQAKDGRAVFWFDEVVQERDEAKREVNELRAIKDELLVALEELSDCCPMTEDGWAEEPESGWLRSIVEDARSAIEKARNA